MKSLVYLSGALIFSISLSFVSCDKEKDNNQPKASFTIDPTSGTTSSIFNFDASYCSDEEDQTSALQVRWDFENDGDWNLNYSSTKTATHQFTTTSFYTVKMEVKDLSGKTDLIFKFINVNTIGTVTDTRDSITYNWLKIGNQTWMAENLAYLPLVSHPDSGSRTNAYYYVYDYRGIDVDSAKATSNYQTYGVIYNWPAVMNGSSSSKSNPSGVQGVCPSGWHIPSEVEWDELINYLGGWKLAGHRIMESGTSHWNPPNQYATNSSGFTALPGGLRYYDGNFTGMSRNGSFWTATESSSHYALIRLLYKDGTHDDHFSSIKDQGFSIRCVKD